MSNGGHRTTEMVDERCIVGTPYIQYRGVSGNKSMGSIEVPTSQCTCMC